MITSHDFANRLTSAYALIKRIENITRQGCRDISWGLTLQRFNELNALAKDAEAQLDGINKELAAQVLSDVKECI